MPPTKPSEIRIDIRCKVTFGFKYILIASRMYLLVLYTYGTTEVELVVASQKSELVSCRMHAFCQNATSSKCYTVVSYTDRK